MTPNPTATVASPQQYVQQRAGFVYLNLPKGQSVSDIASACKTAIQLCRAGNQFNILVNVTGLSEEPPSLSDLFKLILIVAGYTDFRLRTAVIDSHGWLANDNFGQTVTSNRGIHFSVFTHEEEAVAWLLVPAAV